MRQPTVGCCMTAGQFDRVGRSGVVARLVEMKRSKLALHVSLLLKLDSATLFHAAVGLATSLVINTNTLSDDKKNEIQGEGDSPIVPDEDVMNSITRLFERVTTMQKKVDGEKFVSNPQYSKVALAAYNVGKKTLALKLLSKEANPHDKVVAQLYMGDILGASVSANAARSVDLISLVLGEAEKICKSREEFFRVVVTSMPLGVFNILKMYYHSTNNHTSLMGLLISARKYGEAGNVVCKKGIKTKDPEERAKLLREGGRVYGLSKDFTFQKNCAEEQMMLEKEQAQLEDEFGSGLKVVGLSVADTISTVVGLAASIPLDAGKIFATADRIAKKFKVNEKRAGAMKILGMARTQQWGQMRVFSDERKAPACGFGKFAEIGMKHGLGKGEVMRYISRVPKGSERYSLYIKGGFFISAAKEAIALKDARRAVEAGAMCQEEAQRREVEALVRENFSGVV